jgi:hypothetical protein
VNPELKAKWVEALRSGKYQQARGKLRKGEKFCCLGVLCDLVDSSKWSRSRWDGELRLPPNPLIVELGITTQFSYYSTELSNMNDKGKTFPEIADYIEANL